MVGLPQYHVDYVENNNIPCDVVELAPQKPVATTSPKAPTAPAGMAELLLKRSWKIEAALGTIAVRIDGDKVYLLKNGESMTLRLAPGRHVIDVKFQKVLFREPQWDSRLCAQDVPPQTMQAGQRYTVDAADYLRIINR